MPTGINRFEVQALTKKVRSLEREAGLARRQYQHRLSAAVQAREREALVHAEMLRHATQTGLTERQQAVASQRHAFLMELEKLRSSVVNAEEAVAVEFQKHGPRALAAAEIARLRKLALIQERQLDEMQRAYEEEARLFAATSEAVERQRLALHAMAAALGAAETDAETHASDGLSSGDGDDRQAVDSESAAQFFAGEHGAAAAAARVNAAAKARREQWKCEDLSLQIRQERLAHRREVEQLQARIHLQNLGGNGNSGNVSRSAALVAQQPTSGNTSWSSPHGVGTLDAQQAEVTRLREHVLYLRQRSDMFEARAAAAGAAGMGCSDTKDGEDTAAAEISTTSAQSATGGSDTVDRREAEAAELELEREKSEAIEVKLQRLLSLLDAVCPEVERLVPGVASELLAQHGMDTCEELSRAIRVSFWSLVSGRAALQRHLVRAVRVSAEEKRAHAAECATIQAQHRAALKTMQASQQFEKKRAALAEADSVETKRLLEGKLSILESELVALRKEDSATTCAVEQAKEKAAEAYTQSLAPLKAHLRTAKSELLALGKRERLLVSLAEKQREVLSIVDRMSNLEDYEQLLKLSEQRTVLETEVDGLTQQLTTVPMTMVGIATRSTSNLRHTPARAHDQQPEHTPEDNDGGAGAADEFQANWQDDAVAGTREEIESELGDKLLRARLDDVSSQVAVAQAEVLKERERSRAALEKLAQAEGAIAAAEHLRASYKAENMQSPPGDDASIGEAAQRLLLSTSPPPARPAAATDGSTESDVDYSDGSSSDGGSSSSVMSSDTGHLTPTLGGDNNERRRAWSPLENDRTAYNSLHSRLAAAGWGDETVHKLIPGTSTNQSTHMRLPQALPGAPPLPPGLPPSHDLMAQAAEMPATGLPPPPLPTVYDVRRQTDDAATSGVDTDTRAGGRRRRHRRSKSKGKSRGTDRRNRRRHGRGASTNTHEACGGAATAPTIEAPADPLHLLRLLSYGGTSGV
eukprot:COSAG02_NODE_2670_length_8288_cov_6.629792_4_plen_984_part_00